MLNCNDGGQGGKMGVASIENGNEMAQEAVRGELEKLSKQYGLNINEIIGIANSISRENEKRKIRMNINKEQEEINRDPVLKKMYDKITVLKKIDNYTNEQQGGVEFRFRDKDGNPLVGERPIETLNDYCNMHGVKIPNTKEEYRKLSNLISGEIKLTESIFDSLKDNPQLRNLLKNGSQIKVQRSNGKIEGGWDVAKFDGINVTAVNRGQGLQKIIPAIEILTINGTNN